MPKRFQLLAKLDIVIDFSIEDEDDLTIVTEHRLVGRRREIQNRQSPKCKPDRARHVHTVIVRPSMTNRLRHPREHLGPRHRPLKTYHPNKPAHCAAISPINLMTSKLPAATAEPSAQRSSWD